MELVVKNTPASAGDLRDMGLTPGLGISPGGGNSNPLQYSCLKNLMNRGSLWTRVHKVANSEKAEATEHACITYSIE